MVGHRLVPIWDDPGVSVFDTATRQPIRPQLPPGDPAGDDDELDGADFLLFEWLDDDTVALMGERRGRRQRAASSMELATS